MSGPFWGTDKRVLPCVTAWLQNLATFASQVTPPFVQIEFLGLRIGIPWKGGKVLLFRVHLWRYDYYAQAYIFFSSMLKRVNPRDVAP
jgi:hypothetical protein